MKSKKNADFMTHYNGSAEFSNVVWWIFRHESGTKLASFGLRETSHRANCWIPCFCSASLKMTISSPGPKLPKLNSHEASTVGKTSQFASRPIFTGNSDFWTVCVLSLLLSNLGYSFLCVSLAQWSLTQYVNKSDNCVHLFWAFLSLGAKC